MRQREANSKALRLSMGNCVNERNGEFQANERQSAYERIRSMSDSDARRANKFVETHFVGALQIEGPSAFRRHCYLSKLRG